MNLKPTGNKLLIERLPEQKKTEGGIFIPDTSSAYERKIGIGIILDIGPKVDIGSLIRPIAIEDIAYFNKYAGTNIDDKLVIISQDDILGFIKKEETNG